MPHFYYKFYTYAYAMRLSSGVALTKPDAVNAAARPMDRSIAEMERLLAKRKK